VEASVTWPTAAAPPSTARSGVWWPDIGPVQQHRACWKSTRPGLMTCSAG